MLRALSAAAMRLRVALAQTPDTLTAGRSVARVQRLQQVYPAAVPAGRARANSAGQSAAAAAPLRRSLAGTRAAIPVTRPASRRRVGALKAAAGMRPAAGWPAMRLKRGALGACIVSLVAASRASAPGPAAAPAAGRGMPAFLTWPLRGPTCTALAAIGAALAGCLARRAIIVDARCIDGGHACTSGAVGASASAVAHKRQWLLVCPCGSHGHGNGRRLCAVLHVACAVCRCPMLHAARCWHAWGVVHACVWLPQARVDAHRAAAAAAAHARHCLHPAHGFSSRRVA